MPHEADYSCWLIIDDRIVASLAESMKRIQSYIEEEYDVSQEDEAIQDLAQLLTNSLNINE
jgi:hypothetical protein